MRFKLSLVNNSAEEVIGKVTNYDTAENLLIYQSEKINSIKIGVDKYRYNTGFIPDPIKKNKYIPIEEKEVLLKAQLEASRRVASELFGDSKFKIDETDSYFWQRPEYSELIITNDTTRTVYDTNRLEHLILYWQIMSDAFWSVACNIEQAMFKNCPYFIQEIKDAETRDSQEELTKVDAISIIGELKAKGDQEALLYLCWSLGDKNDKMWGFSKSTAIPTLVKQLVQFIDGKTKARGKKLAVNEFIKSYAEYKADREGFMNKIIIRIADYHNYIYPNKENVFVTSSGIVLGKTIDEIIEKLSKPSNRDILEEITQDVMKILTNDL